MQSGRIPNRSITASSYWDWFHGPYRARLNIQKQGMLIAAWSARRNDLKQWIAVDLGNMFNVTRLATQGRQDLGEWVKTYSIKYRKHGQRWELYTEDGRVRVSSYVNTCTLSATCIHHSTPIGDFRVAFRLCFKAIPSAKPFIQKLVLFTHKFWFIYM